MELSRLSSMAVAALSILTIGHGAFAQSPALVPSTKNFPFQEQAFRLRFQPGFFKVGSDLFEDILRSTGAVDETKTLKMKDKAGHPNFVRYSSLKTSLRMEEGRLIAALKINIVEGELFSTDIEGCSVALTGPLGFATVMDFSKDDGSIAFDVPARYFEANDLQMEKRNCGFFANLFASPEYIHQMINDGIKENLGQMISSQEFKTVTKPDVDETLRKARVFLNLPSATKLTAGTKSNFALAVGMRGSLSGSADSGGGLHVVNARNPYLSGLGLEWALDTGFQAMTQNIYDVDFKTATPTTGRNWPEWGKDAYTQNGTKIDFDAGIMLRGTFLKSLFTNLYRAGFFNLQLQDSLLDKKLFSLNPKSWNELFDITLPSGQPLNAANFRDMRIETKMATAPEVTIRDSKSLDLLIPDLTMKLSVQSKDSAMFEVLTFRARFHVMTAPELDEDGQLALRFNEQPVESFELISRSGVGKSITDDDIKNRLNQTIVAILKKAKVEIPLMKNRKVTIPYMGIDGDKASGSEALAIYLKVK